VTVDVLTAFGSKADALRKGIPPSRSSDNDSFSGGSESTTLCSWLERTLSRRLPEHPSIPFMGSSPRTSAVHEWGIGHTRGAGH
jgi:hypothetical protein